MPIQQQLHQPHPHQFQQQTVGQGCFLTQNLIQELQQQQQQKGQQKISQVFSP